MSYNILNETKKQIIEKRDIIKSCNDTGTLLIRIAELDFLKWRLNALNDSDNTEA